jgi:hypothetical protein
MGSDPVSAVLGRLKGALSITTLKVPGSVLAEVTVCASTVEKEREREWATGRGGEVKCAGRCSLKSSSAVTSGSGGEAGSVRVGVLELYRLCPQSLPSAFGSSVALSGGVWGGKTKGSGDGRFRWFPARTTGLQWLVSEGMSER